jgi:large subunit ribosomal protein L25
MAEVVLQAEKRENLSKGTTNELRRSGRIPGIYYFHGEDSVPVSIDEKDLKVAIQSQSQFIDLSIGKSKKKCVIRDVQWEPVSGIPLHVDLLGVKLTEKIAVDLPVHFTGTAIGVKQNGGILEPILREIEVEGLPLDIPESVTVDVSELDIGDSVKVSDLPLDKLTVITDGSQSVVTVSAPRAIEEEVVEVEEAEEGEEAADAEDEETEETEE